MRNKRGIQSNNGQLIKGDGRREKKIKMIVQETQFRNHFGLELQSIWVSR